MSDRSESLNFYRFSSFLVDVGTEVLCQLFLTKVIPEDARTFLNKERQKIEFLCRKKIINPHQKALLDESPVHPEKFDISLLTSLLRNFCLLATEEPVNGWFDPPPENDIGLGADLIRLRDLRNKFLAHRPKAKLSSTEFDDLWSALFDVIKRITRDFDDKEKYQEEIAEIKALAIVTESKEKKNIEVLLLWQVQELQEDQKDLRQRVENLEKINSGQDVTDGVNAAQYLMAATGNNEEKIVLREGEEAQDILFDEDLENVATETVKMFHLAIRLDFKSSQFDKLEGVYPGQIRKQNIILLRKWQEVLRLHRERPRYILAGALAANDNRELALQVAQGQVIYETCSVSKLTKKAIQSISFDIQPQPVPASINVGGAQSVNVFSGATIVQNHYHYGSSQSLSDTAIPSIDAIEPRQPRP